jgi:quinol monooxygenase YgiN
VFAMCIRLAQHGRHVSHGPVPVCRGTEYKRTRASCQCRAILADSWPSSSDALENGQRDTEVLAYMSRAPSGILRVRMTIRHVVTVQVANDKAAEFVRAFKGLQAIAVQEEGCEQYELFQSLDNPDRVVLLERWAVQAQLDKHMQAERTRSPSPVDALVALWAPGVTPTTERFEV